MRSALVWLLLSLPACAPLPPLPPRPDFAHDPAVHDVADRLATFYNWRLTPGTDGYAYGRLVIPRSQLGPFMDHQGDTQAARWARTGDTFVAAGWIGGLALEAAAVAVGAQAATTDPSRNAWWVGLLPAGMLGWTWHWIGDNWFRKPSVALYNKRLAEALGFTVPPDTEGTP